MVTEMRLCTPSHIGKDYLRHVEAYESAHNSIPAGGTGASGHADANQHADHE